MERIDSAVADLREAVLGELVERLLDESPTFFENAVLDVLRAMGYVGKLGRVEHAGKSGDGGIDGVLNLDRLGLERVHVQAKRWEGSVGETVIRDFGEYLAEDLQNAAFALGQLIEHITPR